MSRPLTVVGVSEQVSTGAAGAVSFTIAPHVDTQVGDIVLLYLFENTPFSCGFYTHLAYAADARFRYSGSYIKAWDVRAGDPVGAFAVSGVVAAADLSYYAKAVAITFRSDEGPIVLGALSTDWRMGQSNSTYAYWSTTPPGGVLSDSLSSSPSGNEFTDYDNVVLSLLMSYVDMKGQQADHVPPEWATVGAATGAGALAVISSGSDPSRDGGLDVTYSYRTSTSGAYVLAQEPFEVAGPHGHTFTRDLSAAFARVAPPWTIAFTSTRHVYRTYLRRPMPRGTLASAMDGVGRHYRASVEAGGVRVKRRDVPGWADAVSVLTAVAGATEPSLDHDPLGVVWLLYTAGGNVNQRCSWDGGSTWSAATVAFTGGSHPCIAAGADGSLFRAAYVGGALKGTYQLPGQLAPGAEFTFKDNAGVNLSVANSGFSLSHERGPMGRWWLHVVISGEAAPSNWWSADKGQSWLRS